VTTSSTRTPDRGRRHRTGPGRAGIGDPPVRHGRLGRRPGPVADLVVADGRRTSPRVPRARLRQGLLLDRAAGSRQRSQGHHRGPRGLGGPEQPHAPCRGGTRSRRRAAGSTSSPRGPSERRTRRSGTGSCPRCPPACIGAAVAEQDRTRTVPCVTLTREVRPGDRVVHAPPPLQSGPTVSVEGCDSTSSDRTPPACKPRSRSGSGSPRCMSRGC
jgi:hypothetical protein